MAASASDVNVSVVDVTVPTNAVTLEAGGASAAITINMSVSGNQVGTATFKVYRDWVLGADGTFVGSNSQTFTVPPRSGGDPATTFTTSGTVAADASAPLETKTLAVGAFDIANSNTTGAKLEAGTVSNYQVTVTSPPAPADMTPPTSSATGETASGPYTFGDWTNEDVTITLTGTDNTGGSGLKEIRYTTNGTTPTASVGGVYNPSNKPLVSAEGATTVKFVAVDNEGNVETPVNSVTVKIDKTAPAVTDDSATTAPTGLTGNNGWYTSAVAVTFKASDGLSGFLGENDPYTFTKTTSGEGSAVTVNSGVVNDVAGNASNNVDSATFKIDLTDPEVTCPTPAPTFTLGSTALVTATVSDGISGPISTTASGNADTSAIGENMVEVTGEDNAGRQKTVNCAYNVVYNWTGFFRPVDNLPVLNSVKAGSAVPVKFSLSGNQGLDILASGFPTSGPVACESTAEVDPIEATVTAGGSSLSYDAVSDQYNYVWKTDKAWAGTCRQLVVKLDDGTFHRANFKLTK